MRILAIRGENLASLAESFDIDFEQEPLRSAGLFAITGETGAGKSTILDALCLALYDNFPRVASAGADAGSLDSSGQILSSADPRSILRRGASRGYAEVDFLARDGSRYRARCELARARGKAAGNLQQRARSLRRIDEGGEEIAAVASGVEEVRKKIVELTELTFDQFRRTALLAQGEFDAFLRADSKERAELLEKITGAEVYAQISRRVFQRARDAQSEVATLERRLADIALLDETARAALGDSLENLERQRAELSNVKERALTLLRRHEAISAAQDHVAEATSERDAAELALGALAALRERLLLLQRAEPLRMLAQARDTARAEGETAQSACALALVQESLARDEETRLREEESRAALAQAGAEEELRRFAPLWSQAEALDAQIAVAASETAKALNALAAAREKRLEREKACADLLGAQGKADVDIEAARKTLESLAKARLLREQWSEIEDWLEKRVDLTRRFAEDERRIDQLRKDAVLDDALLEALREDDARDRTERASLAQQIDQRTQALVALDETKAQEQGRALESLAASIGELSLAARRSVEAAREKQDAAGDLEASTGDAQTQAGEIAKLRARRALSEARREEAERLGEIADATLSPEAVRLRASLVAGEACPVCGAHEHPHSHSQDAVKALADELRQRRDALRAEIAGTDAELAQASQRAAAAQVRIEDARRRLEKADGDAARARADYVRLRADWPDDAPAIPHEAGGDAETSLTRCAEEIATRREAVRRKIEQAQRLRAELDALRWSSDERACAMEARRSDVDSLTRKRSGQAEESAELAARAKELRERIESIDRSLSPYLDVSGLSRADLDRDTDGAKARLARKGEQYGEALLRVQQVEAALADLAPRIASAKAKAIEAAGAEQAAGDEASQRKGEDRRLQGERAALLDGEATAAHRARIETRSRETKERFETAASARAGASLRLAGAHERALAAKGAVAQCESKARAAEERWMSGLAAAQMDAASCLELLSLPGEERGKMQASLEDAQQQTTLATAALKERMRDLEEALREGRPEDSSEALSLRVADIDAELARLAEQLGADKERLAADEKARARAGTLGAEMEAARRLHKSWAEINAAIGSASGDKFRRFAQGVTLDHLIALANRRLADLTPRYALERAGGESGDLGLQIVDREMAEERRSTRSLSGGERFLASLALALALCTLEGHDSFVDTLFIDEGFGSLDSATLDVAIDALETLQAQGRRVGVISHVDSMHQRIATQIRVEKRGGGRSVVKLSQR